VINADKIVELLRFAENEYQKLFAYYLNYDPQQKCLINLRYQSNGSQPTGFAVDGSFMCASPASGTAGAGAFSLNRATYNWIGPIDRNNWREKLILLASNVNQLRSLEWPIMIQTGNMGTESYFPNYDQGYDFTSLNWHLAFPVVTGPLLNPTGPHAGVHTPELQHQGHGWKPSLGRRLEP
jgi:hypothetical protein